MQYFTLCYIGITCRTIVAIVIVSTTTIFTLGSSPLQVSDLCGGLWQRVSHLERQLVLMSFAAVSVIHECVRVGWHMLEKQKVEVVR